MDKEKCPRQAECENLIILTAQDQEFLRLWGKLTSIQKNAVKSFVIAMLEK